MNPRGYSQIERALVSLDKSSISSSFGADSYTSFLLRKAERITAAVYILTSFFPDAEPLKWELRDSATTFIKDILSLNERIAVFARESFYAPVDTLTRTISLLSLAHVAELVSPMNFSLFKKELTAVLSLLQDKGSGPHEFAVPALFKSAFFGVAGEPEGRRPMVKRTPPARQRRKARGAAVSEERAAPQDQTAAQPAAESLKDTDKGHGVLEGGVLYKGAEPSSQGQIQVRGEKRRRSKGHIFKLVADKIRAERQQIIVEMLKKKGAAMIKDFSSLIEGCSEKTVQRQIQELVQSGVLKKDGVRRWSRYSLIGSSS